MKDSDLLSQLTVLADEEHAIREREARGTATDSDRSRLAAIEVDLDRCWDLLRQHRARREFGLDVDFSKLRDESTVEGYQQ